MSKRPQKPGSLDCWQLCPRGLCTLSGGNCGVDIGICTLGHRAKELTSCGINNFDALTTRGKEPSTNEIVVMLHLELPIQSRFSNNSAEEPSCDNLLPFTVWSHIVEVALALSPYFFAIALASRLSCCTPPPA